MTVRTARTQASCEPLRHILAAVSNSTSVPYERAYEMVCTVMCPQRAEQSSYKNIYRISALCPSAQVCGIAHLQLCHLITALQGPLPFSRITVHLAVMTLALRGHRIRRQTA